MTNLRAIAALGLVAALAAAAATVPSVAAQQDDRQTALEAINRVRTQNGAGPVAPNAALERAAQRRADDMAARGVVDPGTPDLGAIAEAQAAAGYPSWRGVARVAQELTYASSSGFSGAPAYFLDQARLSRVLLDRQFREVGVASASANGPGGRTTYWALAFGAQPNVLPMFLNDGAGITNDPFLAVRLSQEEVVPAGEGATIVGRVVDVRLSESPQFGGALWQPWEPLVAFTLDGSAGVRTVYVQLRDGAGRTTLSAASIVFDPRSRPDGQPVAPGSDVVAVPAPVNTPAGRPPSPLPVAPTATVAPIPLVITLSPGSIVATPNAPNQVSALAPRGVTPAAPIPRATVGPTPVPASPASLGWPVIVLALGAQTALILLVARRLIRMRA